MITLTKSTIRKVSVVIGVVVILFGFLFALLMPPQVKTVTALRQELRDEFADTYAAEVLSTGEVVEYELSASVGAISLFNGFSTEVWNYNGTVPGPEIRLKLGDTLKVTFTNNLPDETTIHWHGMRVPLLMDGVPGVTQDPVQPGETFIYEFTPKDAGTFWFHPHVRGSEQLERGLYGTVVVEDETSDFYDHDKIWAIDDWLLTEDYQVNENFVTPHDLAHDGRWGNVITTNGQVGSTMEVKPGERMRLRFVNTSNARVYTLSFGDLNAQAIAVDGMYVKQMFNAEGFVIAPGNRLDVDIVAPKEGRYPIMDTYTRYPNTLGTLVVSGEEQVTPQFSLPLNKTIPDWERASEYPSDKTYLLNARSNGMGMMGGIEWMINGKAYPDFDGYRLTYNSFNKLTITNQSFRLHPMHLHGQFFKVLTRNGIPADEQFMRDTVLLGAQETVEIGIVPLDKGTWAYHCHIQEHADAGMMSIITVE